MKNKRLVIQIGLSIIAIAAIVVCSVFISKKYKPKADGQLKIILVDIDGNITKEKNIGFKKDDTIDVLLENNFENVTITNGMLMTIETFVTPEDFSQWICIYVDDVMSEVGVLDIKYIDGTKITFQMTLLSSFMG